MSVLKIALVGIVLFAIVITAVLSIGMLVASVGYFRNKECGEGAFALFGTFVLALMVVLEVMYWLP